MKETLMKRTKIFGLAAAVTLLMMNGAVHAQDLKFDGYINSGAGLVSDNNEDNEAHLKAFGVDSEHHGYRFRLNGAYTNEAKNAGIKFRLQSQTNLDAASAAGYFSLPYALGWVSFLDNVINLSGGIIEDSTWSTGDFWLASDSVSHFAGLGTLLKITPVEGLIIGSGFYPINRNSGSSNNTLFTKNLTLPVAWYDAKYTLHGVYTMKDMFRVGLSFRTESATPGQGATPESSNIYGEFRFLGLKPLTAAVAAKFDWLGEDFDSKGDIIFSETFGYKISDELNLGLNAAQFLYNRKDANNDKVDMNPGLFFNLWGSYAIDKIVPRLDLVFFAGGRSRVAATTGNNLSNNNDNWARKDGFVNVAREKDEERDLSVFSVRPSVKFNLDGKTTFEIGDMINIDSGNYDGAYADSGDADKKSRLTNVFYIDFKWSF